jgi:hypothetical protein
MLYDCIERRWMATIATQIFNNRNSLRWYSHRALFQAIDLFDRYIYAMSKNIENNENFVESDMIGSIHTRFDAELRFTTCMYLCIKYFTSIHYPISYDDVASEKYRTYDAKMIAENFEGGFIKNCLQYNVYRPTIYEVADDFCDRLDDVTIRDLIILYSMNSSLPKIKITLRQLYIYHRDNLKGKPIENLYLPINL